MTEHECERYTRTLGELISGQDARLNALTFYRSRSKDMAFANIQRSLKIVEEVWRRYDRGGAWVDWLDVVADFDWELFIV